MTYRDSPRRATRDANVTQCIRAQDLVHTPENCRQSENSGTPTMILAEHDRDRVVFLATRPRLTLADDMRLEVNVNLVGN